MNENVDKLLDTCNRCGSRDDAGYRFFTDFFDEEEGWTCADCAFKELKSLRGAVKILKRSLGETGYVQKCKDLRDQLGAVQGERDEWEKRSKDAENENTVLRRMLMSWFPSSKELEQRIEMERRAILDARKG